MFSLRLLHEKNEERINYLQTRHVLPFFYKYLNDKDPEIQALAIYTIKSFGSLGEVLFSEGISKDSNQIIRSKCAIGLGNNLYIFS